MIIVGSRHRRRPSSAPSSRSARRARSAGPNWLFGDQYRAFDDSSRGRNGGVPTERLLTARPRLARPGRKRHVQHRMAENAAELWIGLQDGGAPRLWRRAAHGPRRRSGGTAPIAIEQGKIPMPRPAYVAGLANVNSEGVKRVSAGRLLIGATGRRTPMAPQLMRPGETVCPTAASAAKAIVKEDRVAQSWRTRTPGPNFDVSVRKGAPKLDRVLDLPGRLTVPKIRESPGRAVPEVDWEAAFVPRLAPEWRSGAAEVRSAASYGSGRLTPISVALAVKLFKGAPGTNHMDTTSAALISRARCQIRRAR